MTHFFLPDCAFLHSTALADNFPLPNRVTPARLGQIMHPFLRPAIIAVACLLNTAVFASADEPLASQVVPIQAKARRDAKYYPVCDASGLDPKVKFNGKAVDADASPRIRITPGIAFGTGKIKFEEARLTHWSEVQQLGDSLATGDPTPLSLSFSGKVTSDTDLKDCFLVFVFFRPSTIERPGAVAPFYLAGVKEVGTLKAGKTKRIKADYDVSLLKNFDRRDFGWFVVLQSGEQQIPSTGAPNAADSLFEALIEWQRTKNGQ